MRKHFDIATPFSTLGATPDVGPNVGRKLWVVPNVIATSTGAIGVTAMICGAILGAQAPPSWA